MDTTQAAPGETATGLPAEERTAADRAEKPEIGSGAPLAREAAEAVDASSETAPSTEMVSDTGEGAPRPRRRRRRRRRPAPVAAAAETVTAFAEPITLVEGSDAFFRSFYARFAVSPPLTALKRALDPEALGSFMPHVSLLYGPVEPTAKTAAIAEVNARLAGRSIHFDRIGIVTSGQDISIAEWRVVASVPLRTA